MERGFIFVCQSINDLGRCRGRAVGKPYTIFKMNLSQVDTHRLRCMRLDGFKHLMAHGQNGTASTIQRT